MICKSLFSWSALIIMEISFSDYNPTKFLWFTMLFNIILGEVHAVLCFHLPRLRLLPGFIPPEEADWMFSKLLAELPWSQKTNYRQGVYQVLEM